MRVKFFKFVFIMIISLGLTGIYQQVWSLTQQNIVCLNNNSNINQLLDDYHASMWYNYQYFWMFSGSGEGSYVGLVNNCLSGESFDLHQKYFPSNVSLNPSYFELYETSEGNHFVLEGHGTVGSSFLLPNYNNYFYLDNYPPDGTQYANYTYNFTIVSNEDWIVVGDVGLVGNLPTGLTVTSLGSGKGRISGTTDFVGQASVGVYGKLNSYVKTATKQITINMAQANILYIQASATGGGSITPSGRVSVPVHGSQTFHFSPDPGYHVSDVKVDGYSVGNPQQYTFEDTTKNHTLEVAFDINHYTITSTAGLGGTISPLGETNHSYGDNVTYSIGINNGYDIAALTVDGKPVPVASVYTFSMLADNHTIAVTFKTAPGLTSYTQTTALGSNNETNFSGIYQFKNLTLWDNVQLVSNGISHLVIKVDGNLTMKKGAMIVVRNGYYADAPGRDIATITEDILAALAVNQSGIPVYPGVYGRGGDGGLGGGGMGGNNYNCDVGYGTYVTIKGRGGSGGGGGGGGFGGGRGGSGGSGAWGPAGDGYSGNAGENSGGNGGKGGANSNPGLGGGALGVGLKGPTGGGASGSGGSGGGGNGGAGGNGARTASGTYCYDQACGTNSGGGGGGGYGGGVLTIIAKKIITEEDTPHFIVSGQAGGSGDDQNYRGDNGQGGLLSITACEYAYTDHHWTVVSGDTQYPQYTHGHGRVTGGPGKVLLHVSGPCPNSIPLMYDLLLHN